MNEILEELREYLITHSDKDTVSVELRLNYRGWQVMKKQGEGKNIKNES